MSRTRRCPASVGDHRGVTTRRRECDMRREARRERRADPLHALQLLERSECTVRFPISDDPGGERGSDPRKEVERSRVGAVEVDRFPRRGHRARRRRWCRPGPARRGGRRLPSTRLASGRPAAATGDRRIHPRDLVRERCAVGRRDRILANGTEAPHAGAQHRDRSDEQEGPVFGGSRHARTQCGCGDGASSGPCRRHHRIP